MLAPMIESRFVDRDDLPARLPANTALLSIFGFWLFYVLIVTLRVSTTDIPVQDELALRRIYVTLVGMAITVLVWLIMRRVDQKSITVRIFAAAATCVPAAFAIALANHYFFNLFDQASLMEVEDIRAASPLPGQFILELTEVAVSRYFFLIAWAALYLALGYAHQVRRAERITARYARSAQLSELRALRFQLNPHFLFNTLNSLSSLVMHGRRQEAEAMILNLSSFYRANLGSDPSGDVPLSAEIETQRIYLAIETMRFPDRLTIAFDVPDELGDALVPGMILQPLVENAVKHGVAKTNRPVLVSISARQESDVITLSVQDDAPNVQRLHGDGVGLTNVQDRLRARFGTEGMLRAEPTTDGFLASIRLPYVCHA